MNIIEEILYKLDHDNYDENKAFPEHKPEMLLIGCVDARKDPTSDLGINRGRALILRNIGALIRGTTVTPEQRETESAALEFAVKVMKVKHIVVMGHTDCGGIRASLMETELKAIKKYLSPLNELRNEIQSYEMTLDEQARLMEIEAVKMSIKNLLTYEYIQAAVDNSTLSVHGWLMDLATGKLTQIT